MRESQDSDECYVGLWITLHTDPIEISNVRDWIHSVEHEVDRFLDIKGEKISSRVVELFTVEPGSTNAVVFFFYTEAGEEGSLFEGRLPLFHRLDEWKASFPAVAYVKEISRNGKELGCHPSDSIIPKKSETSNVTFQVMNTKRFRI